MKIFGISISSYFYLKLYTVKSNIAYWASDNSDYLYIYSQSDFYVEIQ